jgi:hypothetical protein
MMQEEGTRTRRGARWGSEGLKTNSRAVSDVVYFAPVKICRKETDMISKGDGQSSCPEDSSYKS